MPQASTYQFYDIVGYVTILHEHATEIILYRNNDTTWNIASISNFYCIEPRNTDV